MHADPAKLMYAGKGPNRRMISDRHMARERRRIGQNNVIAEQAVMTDMNICHQEIVIADPRLPAASFSASMNIHVFAEYVVVSDSQKRIFTLEFQVLWLKADSSKRIELIVIADRCWSLNHDVRFEAAAVSDFYSGTNSAKRPNDDVLTNFRLWTHYGSRMNHGCRPMEESSMASAASSAPT